jgi:hypothetical protein
MIPTVSPSDLPPSSAADDVCPRFFLDDTYDAGFADGDWWLDLGSVALPVATAV